ncbi:hypothetical protein SAMN05421863_11753 [Nitrosomonas communis]|uniref:Uncharacterized protein n=1 Tax=Nitrosomonas communis TaxID=44574 RepID=A0A1I4XTF8_9PROT|nr:hypothetical protein SAMN05421863_11241 [Nitrosomonas communis]SFN28683.1 hypothetical protein SAMN05421863_11753 [Nitrosomonas communis]
MQRLWHAQYNAYFDENNQLCQKRDQAKLVDILKKAS